MEMRKPIKLTAMLLAVLMLFSVIAVSAEELLIAIAAASPTINVEEEATEQSLIAEVKELMSDVSYVDYISQYAGLPQPSEAISFKAASYSAFSGTEAQVAALHTETVDGVENALYTPDGGTISWIVNVGEAGLYSIDIAYYQVEGKATDIERIVKINGEVPFSEARSLVFKKYWVDVYNYDEDGNVCFGKDASGNEIRFTKKESPRWSTYSPIDSNGYVNGEFCFWLDEGENVVSLTAQREPVILDTVSLHPAKVAISYEEYLAKCQAAGYTAPAGDDVAVKIQAEYPAYTSDRTIYAISNRSSSITEPQQAGNTVCNCIGGDKWQTVGQWIEWEFDIAESGMYSIDYRYLQSTADGLFTSRTLMLDGEVPFAEAYNLEFMYGKDFKTIHSTDGTTDFQFYLSAGHHTLRLRITLGNLGSIIQRLKATMADVNNIYLSILKITGSNPDEYTDYKFYQAIPDKIQLMRASAATIREIVAEFAAMSGMYSSNTATLENVARILETMARSEYNIAKNLSSLKDNIGTFGKWLNDVNNQSLTLDYIYIQPAGSKLPRADDNFFEAAWFEIKNFVMSFFIDYSYFGSSGEGTAFVDVWMITAAVNGLTAGRDQAQIVRQMINESFTPETGINANLKLVANGTLLPAILSGQGPDVVMTSGQTDVINYAIRGAVKSLNDFPGFEEVTNRFLRTAVDAVTLYGKTYGIPETMNYYMMFYRKDVLADMDLDVPDSWNDLKTINSTLSSQNLLMGIPSARTDPNGYYTFLYQMGGELYKEDGQLIAFDENVGLRAFTNYCSYFTDLSFPVTYDSANRFRTGEMPILIADFITFYNQFTCFATELKGLWGFTIIPGTIQEDGSVNHTAAGSCTAMIMMRDCEDTLSAWEYMKWWTRYDTQGQYSNELVALLGPAGKYSTANVEALYEMPWTSAELKEIKKVINPESPSLKCNEEMPGGYILARNVKFAFMKVYNEKTVASETMLDYIDTINKELTRKRLEFDLEVSDKYK